MQGNCICFDNRWDCLSVLSQHLPIDNDLEEAIDLYIKKSIIAWSSYKDKATISIV